MSVLKHILFELINDSDEEESLDSSSDSEEEINCLNYKRRRVCIKNYFEEVVPSYSDYEFIRHFRINRTLFEQLSNKLEKSNDFKELDSNKVYSANKHVAVFLWFAGHEACSFRDIADRFDLSISTVCLIIKRVNTFLSDMANSVILWPNDSRRHEIADWFITTKKIPGVIGAIDGTHIIIDPPKTNKDDYIDRKNNYSLCVQAVCDERRKFTDVLIGFPGSAHDSRVLKNSNLYHNLASLCDGYYILGDSAYPCSVNLLTPYRDNGHLTAAQKNYNKIHSSSRVVIEHTFGILKQRFRQLYYCKLKGISKLCHFIRACCVLHNLADIKDLDLLENYISDVYASNTENLSETDQVDGKALRDEICRQLFVGRS